MGRLRAEPHADRRRARRHGHRHALRVLQAHHARLHGRHAAHSAVQAHRVREALARQRQQQAALLGQGRGAHASHARAASHPASAEDTRCAKAGSRSTEHDARRLLPATWNTVPSPAQPARCATLRTTAASRYSNTACPSVHPSRLTGAKPGAPAGATHSAPPSVTPTTALRSAPTWHTAPSEGMAWPTSRSREPPAAGPLSGTTASTSAGPTYCTQLASDDRAWRLSPTLTAAAPARLATAMHSSSCAVTHRAGTGATLPKAQCRPTDSENSSPATATADPPASLKAAGLAPTTRGSRAKVTPAPSEEPPTRRVAGPSSGQAASHTASAVDTRCAGAATAADSQPTEHDACRLLPATWNRPPGPAQPARCATLRTTAASRYWNTTAPGAEPSRLTRAKPGAPAGSTHSTPP